MFTNRPIWPTLTTGLAIWAAGTIGLRLAGPPLLDPSRHLRVRALYAVSAVVMAGVTRRIYRRRGWPADRWRDAATLLTLGLDPVSCVFVSTVFPALDPAAAGIFGGWTLTCGAGAVAGAWITR